MKSPSPWLLLVPAALLLGGLLYEEAPADALPGEGAAIAPPAPAPPSAPPKARRAAIPAPRASAPAPVSTGPTVTSIEAAPKEAEEDEEAEEHGGVDPALPLTPQSLQTVADRMRPSIAACVEAWTAELPALRGEVVLGFQLNAEGVQEAWVVEHDEVPPAVLGCFSAAVYEQDWPAAPDGVEVTFPFTIEAGLADDPDAGPPVDRRGEAEAAPR